ncbi:methylmalonyl Co-A mutase-associated GTPase MeaB [Thermodesulfobacteriota bacterium]
MSEILDSVLSGNIRTIARLISDIDNNVPYVRDVLRELYPHTGNAYIIGVTGAPGVGKSTLVDRMIESLRNDNKKVGVIAIDPTSPFSGGAILGDRIRMQRHSSDRDIFIRSLATRGYLGGLTLSTRGTIDVMDAMGKDYIIIETVGVGQDEVDIVKKAHTTAIVVIPGMGDDIQAIKAGILEAGDIFIINKADRDGADITLNDLRVMIEMGNKKEKENEWIPPLFKTVATSGEGVEELMRKIESHREFLISTLGSINLRRSSERAKEELIEIVKSRLVEKAMEGLESGDVLDDAVQDVTSGQKDPYTVSDELIKRKLNI